MALPLKDLPPLSSVRCLEKLCSQGKLSEALHLSQALWRQGAALSSHLLRTLLRGCIRARNVEVGKRLCSLINRSGFGADSALIIELVRLFCLTGNLRDATGEFQKLPQRSRSIWNLMIWSHAKHGQGKHAIQFFHEMQQARIRPDAYTYTAVLKACASTTSLEQGKHVHGELVRLGFQRDVVLGNALVEMYAKCGELELARQSFSEMSQNDAVTWTCLINGCIRAEKISEAFSLFSEMQENGVLPDRYTYVSVLKACGKIGALDMGKTVHSQLVEGGFELDLFVGNSLIDMYAKCGSFEDAWQLFNQLQEHDLVSWNTVISGCVQHGRFEKALQLFQMMQVDEQKPDKITYLSIFKACGSLKALDQGKDIHRQLIESGLHCNLSLGNSLIDMYSKCASIDDARKVFLQLPYRDIISWTAMMDGCNRHGHAHEAFQLFKDMQGTGLEPDVFTYASILKACSILKVLDQGRRIHAQLMESGLNLDVFLGNSLLDMYVKCGSMDEAHKLFDELPKRDVISWNTIIAGCVQHGREQLAIQLYEKMQKVDIVPDRVTLISLLKACGSLGILNFGNMIYTQVLQNGLEFDSVLGNSLIGMYGKCGCMEKAHELFLKLPVRDVISWTTLIDTYVQQGQAQKALEFFEKMKKEGTKPDRIILLSVLKACSSIKSVNHGKSIHMELKKDGMDQDTSICNALIDMYAKCENISEANRVFLEMPNRDEVSWNTMITGYAQQGELQEALHLFKKMQEDGQQPGTVAYMSLLGVCGKTGALAEGKMIHKQLIESGLPGDINLGNALLDMYMRCAEVNVACEVFFIFPERNVVSWTTMIDGCARHGKTHMAFTLFQQMQEGGLKPDVVAFSSILKLCANTGKLDHGRIIHAQLLKSGLKWDILLGSTLVDMYVCCGDLEKAHEIFFQLPERDVISYNAIITGYALQGHGDKSLTLFDKMKDEGLHPDKVTFAAVLKACGHLGGLQMGKLIHEQLVQLGWESDLILGNALVDMYSKCGSIAEANKLFLKLPERDVISWTAMIDGYAQQGRGQEALRLFEEMQAEGVLPDTVTLRCVLSACSHSGLVNDGHRIFHGMHELYGINPTLEHYTCMVDLLGRAGYLREAHDFINQMPLQPSAALWTSLLGSCRTYKNLELGLLSFKAILQLEPSDEAAYILMSSIYASSGRSKHESK